MDEYSLLEGTGQVNGSSDNTESSESVNSGELGVVGKLEGSSDSLEGIGGDLLELRARDQGERLSNGGELREISSAEGVVDEGSRAVDLLELGEVDVTSITNGDVVGPLEVGEGGVDTLSVGLNKQQVGDLGQGNVDATEVAVVVNVEALGGLQVNSLEGVEEGVGDENAVGLGDLLGESKVLEGRESGPVDVSNGNELGESQVGKNNQSLESEGSSNGAETRSLEGNKVGSSVGNDITSDAGQGSRKGNGGDLLSEGNLSSQLRARSQLGNISIALDSNILVTGSYN